MVRCAIEDRERVEAEAGVVVVVVDEDSEVWAALGDGDGMRAGAESPPPSTTLIVVGGLYCPGGSTFHLPRSRLHPNPSPASHRPQCHPVCRKRILSTFHLGPRPSRHPTRPPPLPPLVPPPPLPLAAGLAVLVFPATHAALHPSTLPEAASVVPRATAVGLHSDSSAATLSDGPDTGDRLLLTKTGKCSRYTHTGSHLPHLVPSPAHVLTGLAHRHERARDRRQPRRVPPRLPQTRH